MWAFGACVLVSAISSSFPDIGGVAVSANAFQLPERALLQLCASLVLLTCFYMKCVYVVCWERLNGSIKQ